MQACHLVFSFFPHRIIIPRQKPYPLKIKESATITSTFLVRTRMSAKLYLNFHFYYYCCCYGVYLDRIINEQERSLKVQDIGDRYAATNTSSLFRSIKNTSQEFRSSRAIV